MTDELEPKEVARRHAITWLNRVNRDSPTSVQDDQLPDDYFTGVEVMYDSGESLMEERIMLLSLETDDEGGSAMMFCHFADEAIWYSTWYFDGTWGEMK